MADLTPPQQALRHLELLGKDPAAAWFRAIKHGTNANSRRDGADLHGFSREELRSDAIDGHALYLVIGDASTASGKAGGVTDADITAVPALFVEWDDITTDEQLTAWQRLGLPTPTLMLTTGGKSVHAYWRLQQPLHPAEWKTITARLIDHCSSDKACRNPSRVMRLAGSLYIDKATGMPTGARAEIVHEAQHAIYSIEQITSCLPEPARPSPSPPPPLSPHLDAIPVEQLLSRDQLRTWEQGAPEGQRNDTAFSLACSLLAVHEAALAAGLPTTGSPEDALIDFGRRCSPPIDDRETTALLRSASSAPRTPDPGWPDRLRYHLNRKARQQRQQHVTAADEAAEPAPEPIRPSAGGYFTCLGFDADAYYYQPHRTGQVMRLSRSSHTGTNLVALAPLGYWEGAHPGGRGGPNWTAAASQLFEDQAKIGVYSPDRIRGRGAWWDQGRSVLHLGDRLLVDGQERTVMQRVPSSPFLYQRLSSLQGPRDAKPLTDEESFMLWDIADRFHWDVPASGLLLAGWVTLAPICGALPWRPHAWLTAAAGSGKSAILDRYVTPLLGDMGLIVAGNTTEPGIRQALRADALPVVFDEAESNERTDQQRMQAILGLARVASSESKAHTLKGSPEGDTQRYTIRSMFLMSSIATSLKQGADRSRFAQLTLRSPHDIPKHERIAHWQELDRDLDRHISDETGRRLQARTISLIPTIRASIRVFTRVAAERFDSQRLGDQYGTLLAGAWSLRSSEVVTDHEAQALIDINNWEPYSQATEIPDERRCIQRILQHQIRVEADKPLTRSIGELVEIALHWDNDGLITADLAQSTLGRHGIKAEPGVVLVSNNSEAVATILRDTSWSNCWPTVLTRLPGATKAGSIYFRGAGTTSRAVRVPLDAVDRVERTDGA
jgi:hypothetical protein